MQCLLCGASTRRARALQVETITLFWLAFLGASSIITYYCIISSCCTELELYNTVVLRYYIQLLHCALQRVVL